MSQKEKIAVAKSDLLAAWQVLENLAISFDQIGSVFACAKGADNGEDNTRTFQEALASYLTPDLVRAINQARVRLGRYIPDSEAELLSEQIPYWDYAKLPVVTGEPSS